MATLDGDVFDGAQEMLFGEFDDSRSGIVNTHAERQRDMFLNGSGSGVEVQVKGSTRRLAGSKPSENEVGVGNGWQCAAAAVTGRAGISASTFGSDEQHASIVNPGDGAASGTNGVNIDGRRGHVIASDVEIVASGDLAPGHEQYVA